MLRNAKRLSPEKTYRLLDAIRNVIRDLGFLPSANGGLHELPSPGTVIAAHPNFMQGNVAAEVLVGKRAEDWAPDVEDPLPIDDDPATQEGEPENIPEDEGPDLSM